MRLLDLTLPTAAENLALDEALLIAAEEGAGGEALRFWELESLAAVVGAGGSVALDVNEPACQRDGIPILRRSSGGGTVLLGPGCLCFSFILSYERAPGLDQIPISNRYVLGRVLHALAKAAPAAAIEGTSDLAIAEARSTLGPKTVKFSGNAQQRKRQFFLHHGTLLYNFDLELIGRYLNSPEKQPAYRHNRSHGDFVTNLSASARELKDALLEEWQPEDSYEPIPWEAVKQLVKEKYARPEWNLRR